MSKPVITLSSSGWARTPQTKADFLLAHFFMAEYSQTHLYRNNVSSLPYLLTKYAGDVHAFASNCRITLDAYLRRYFDSAVSTVDIDPDSLKAGNGRVDIRIGAIVTQDGVSASFGYLVHTLNGAAKKIIKINNDGPGSV